MPAANGAGGPARLLALFFRRRLGRRLFRRALRRRIGHDGRTALGLTASNSLWNRSMASAGLTLNNA